MYRRGTRIAAIVVGVVSCVLLVRYAVPWAMQRVASGVLGGMTSMRFAPASWANESVENIPAAVPAALDACWQDLQAALAPPAPGQPLAPTATLVLPTGRILATDLNFVDENLPLRRPVKPGRYPVYGFTSARHIVAAVVLQTGKPPVSWVVADAYGDAPAQLRNPNGVWGVSLDSSAIVVDAMVCTRQMTFNPWPIINGTAASVTVDRASGANAVLAELGGVGVHHPYWGLDDAGEPVVLFIIGY